MVTPPLLLPQTTLIPRPLFHYHPGEIHFDETAWDAYRQANAEFAQKIADIVEDGDLIWVQDYHLMVLPRLLRKAIGNTKKDVKIGFFLHTPFPSSEIYRILPVRSEILEGVLPCDLIGFHTYDYARHFLSACNRVLNLSTMPNAVQYKGRTVNVATIPIGIDPEKFTDVYPPLSPSWLPNGTRKSRIRNVRNGLRSLNKSSRARKLLSVLIDSITSRESLRNSTPLKSSSLNTLNGTEKSLPRFPGSG